MIVVVLQVLVVHLIFYTTVIHMMLLNFYLSLIITGKLIYSEMVLMVLLIQYGTLRDIDRLKMKRCVLKDG